MPLTSSDLAGLRILIIEHEPFIADYIRQAIDAAGAVALGPVPTVGDALKFLDEELPDAATLNTRLRDEPSFQVADRLVQLRIPFLFLSSSVETLPVRLLHIPLMRKPFAAYQVVEELRRFGERRSCGPTIRGH